MSREDFTELVVTKRVCTRDKMARIPWSSDYDEEVEMRQRYIPQLEAILKEEERVRQRVEARKQKHQSILAEANTIKTTNGRMDAEKYLAYKVADCECMVQKAASECHAIKQYCEHELDQVIPVLEHAFAEVERLHMKDMCEVKAYGNPPPLVVTVLGAVCIFFGEEPTWARAKRLLSDSCFLQRLLHYEKDNISTDILRKLDPYIADPSFDPNVVRRMSIAAAAMCSWVRAMCTYSQALNVLAPRISALKDSEETLADAQVELQAWQECWVQASNSGANTSDDNVAKQAAT
jgi:hypothetical protein